jgi:ATP-binding cassette, subfamily C, bacterial CydCD
MTAMRPTDPRLRRQLGVARRPLLLVGASGVLGALLMVAQAFVVTSLVLAVVHGHAVLGWAVAVAAVFMARGLVGWLSDVAAARAAGLVGVSLRRQVVTALLGGGGSGASSGALSVLATRGVSAAEPYLTRYLPALVLAGVLPVVTLVALVVMDPGSALIVVVTLPLIPIFGILVGLATRDRATAQWSTLQTLSGHFLDVVRGLPTLVAYRRAKAQSEVIRRVTDAYRVRTLETLRIAFLSSAILELVATISVALVAVTVGIRLASGHLGLHTALVVLLLAPEAYWPLRRVGTEFHAAAEGVATFEAVADLDASPGRAGASAHGDPAESALVHQPVRAPLHVEGVSVTYPDRLWPALAEVSLDLPATGVTAVVGPSGCGKSTLLRVLAGLTPPSSGRVRLGSMPWGAEEWRDQVALLPQRPVFVQGTVADNLRLAATGATDRDLWDALARVRLDARIRALPGGLDADLAEDGRSLSAGERARLALARVLLADRPWVLLDEPTAHLDPATERIIAETVVELGRTRGVVLVAHRASLVAVADRVAEIAPPAVVEPAAAPATARPGPARPEGRVEEPRGPGRAQGRLWTAAVLGGLSSASGVALTALAGWLIVRAAAMPGVLALTVAMVGVRTFGLARPVLGYVERLRAHDAALRLLAATRVGVYDALVPLVPGALGRRRGDLLTAIVDDADTVLDRELRVRLPVRAYVVTAVIAVAATAALDLRAGAVTAALCLAVTAAYPIARRRAAAAESRLVADRAALADTVVEATQAADELVMWRAEERILGRVDEAGRAMAQASASTARGLGAARAWVLTAAGLAVAAVALLLRDPVAGGDLGGPVFALLLLTPLALAEPAATLADAGAAQARARAAQERLDDLLHRAPAVTDPAAPRPVPEGTDLHAHVTARFGATTVLDGLDLTVAPGEKVAVVGPSGSGKSTLAALLLRHRDPDEGAVALAGTDLRDLALDGLRERLGQVDDDPHVFASTVVENVRLARPAATDAEVEQSLRESRLGPWLDGLPQGLDTRLGDGGSAVSGGERARLAIARARLADLPVLVLDEPVAHLDSSLAEAIAGDVLGSDRSVVWISHAAAGLDLAHRIIALGSEDG